MNTYIEYKYRGKCNECNDPIWTSNDLESVVCKCGNSNISKGVLSNCLPLLDEEMVEYINLPQENIIIIKI